MEFHKYVEVNKRDLRYAIEEGRRPMREFYDPRHENLPFFGNLVSGDGCEIGNFHYFSACVAHIPGRWLNALLNAEDVLGERENDGIIDDLAKWAYRAMEEGHIGVPACYDTKTIKIIPQCDLHNMREQMHALYALVKYRDDKHAYKLALDLMDTVDKYFDYDNCRLRKEEYVRDTGADIFTWAGTWFSESPFPITFGRLIGPLVKFFQATGERRALEQAIRLKDSCFAHVLNEAGDYDVEHFGTHTHSTTCMISSLAQLGDVLNDESILRRVKNFMENGLKKIALSDFGWVIENYHRADSTGEINNSADLMETCLILGAHGYPGYFAQAERIIRGHILPSQLLDTHFVPDDDDPDHVEKYHLASRIKGSWGFPSPFGHEDSPGAQISYNYDIVAGAVGGLCEAFRSSTLVDDKIVRVALLFDQDNEYLTFTSPYGCEDTATLIPKKEGVRYCVRIPGNCTGVRADDCGVFVDGEWAYISVTEAGKPVLIHFDFVHMRRNYYFREKKWAMLWRGEEVERMTSEGKRLCFFPEYAV